ncbi:hypothetical protein SODALDRAFT_125168 [Sodiomyces alkalinus F11]|uniref:Uncharacterized protein n=1 Tax=Sodiomyces alkalinus (strain CBS 110278 / VKM F-3762 / F11) TaxID=1314773 RepID=A0A3N2Q4V8_SODAK|nr:hypothetical protein SODALDRAFT_125168 [Sodiomyces alkalinus F11]ROT41655.1 hypothetical protein SODALDRAFT_125168 [Sodiomyces alkalinus F11]
MRMRPLPPPSVTYDHSISHMINLISHQPLRSVRRTASALLHRCLLIIYLTASIHIMSFFPSTTVAPLFSYAVCTGCLLPTNSPLMGPLQATARYEYLSTTAPARLLRSYQCLPVPF